MINTRFRYLHLLLAIVLFASFADAQKKDKKKPKENPKGKPVIMKPVDIASQDLFTGPGGKEMQPDAQSFKFVKQETEGHSKKYRVEDASGKVWVAKVGSEAQPETAAVRLIAALGYPTEINYLLPTITIPGKGTFKNVRLEARPENIKREGTWDWNNNPFKNTNELQGLKLMSVLMNNWDAHTGNNVLLYDKDTDELLYANSDMGATFGSYGMVNLPIFNRLGSKNHPKSFAKSKFIKGVKDGRIKFAFIGNARKLYGDITVAQGRWIADKLLQLSDSQIRDAFRAANYSQSDIDILSSAIEKRIKQLDQITSQERLAKADE